MDLSKWIEIKDKEYEREHPPDFMTHLNYVGCLNVVLHGLTAECKLEIKNKIKENKILDKKIKLIKLITKSLNEELKAIKVNLSFAEVCVPWIAVKAYYLLFNLFLIAEYLISGQESFFNSSHEGLLKKLKNHIKKKDIVFNKEVLNTNFRCSEIINTKVKLGANLKIVGVNLEERVLQILKKLIYYKIDDFQRKEKIKNFRSKKDRERKKEFLENNNINICEFFYWYRIKSNYRDLEFLDKDIDDEQFKVFYKNYFELTVLFFKALKGLINDLSKKRLNKEIL